MAKRGFSQKDGTAGRAPCYPWAHTPLTGVRGQMLQLRASPMDTWMVRSQKLCTGNLTAHLLCVSTVICPKSSPWFGRVVWRHPRLFMLERWEKHWVSLAPAME